MGLEVVCPGCGYSEKGSRRRGAHLGACPDCGTQMRAHTAGMATGRYVCPVTMQVCTHGLGATVELTEPMRLAFVPGWDHGIEPDPDRPGWNRRVGYHRDQAEQQEQEALKRAGGRVFGPGCVISSRYQLPASGEPQHGRAGIYLVPVPATDPATWFVNEPVTYRKCAACPKRVPATSSYRIDHDWSPARGSFWQGIGQAMRRIEISQGPHPAGSYACPDCRPAQPAATPPVTGPPDAGAGTTVQAAPEITSQISGPTGRDPRQRRASAGRSYVQCAAHGEQIVLAFPYDASMVREAQAVGGRYFDWDTRTNVYPFTRLPQVVAFADAHGISVSPQIRALLPAAARLVRAEAAQQQATRRAAHLYLNRGLLPVPAWTVTSDGTCSCPRRTACPRPGKHPRSVHTGPGPHDYSWKPLACSTQADIERRFGPGQEYANANLMLAIPEGMLVIDQDLDDGGRDGLAALIGRLGELPATLGHDTPHGTHQIYRTPPGWTTRAWVGKDARNPLPAGIDLRVPGQILMAPPSRVPGVGALASYGPTARTTIADLPAAYLNAWTPRQDPARPTRQKAPLPPGRADVAAAYVHARIDGIAGDLAALKPGGRNTAIYTAALKAGSTLAAARSTPEAEQAAAAWTDQAAEDALMAAAEQNGYISDHSAAEARSAIRSGLRNGLRNPRPLPEFGTRRAAPNMAYQRPPSDLEPGAHGAPAPDLIDVKPASSRDPGKVSPARQLTAPGREPIFGQIPEPKEAEEAEAKDLSLKSGRHMEIADWRNSTARKEREERRPKTPSSPDQAVATEPTGSEIGR